MERLELYRGASLVARFEVGERAVEIGREIGCDIVLDDPQVAPRHWLFLRRNGTVMAVDVSFSGPVGRARAALPRAVPVARTWPLSVGYHVIRTVSGSAGVRVRDRETVASSVGDLLDRDGFQQLCLWIGRGPGAQAQRLDALPVHVGRSVGNDLVVRDRRVSAYHFRIEPQGCGLLLRDLRSRNGTFVQGVRVERALLSAGTRIRVGDSELWVGRAKQEASSDGLGLLASSSEMLAVLDELRRMAPLSWPVLIRGESGTGKEGMAASLHRLSPRASGPFVTLNAGGIAPELVESELFGHERGAFTGATSLHRGVFEQAHTGTLFLDEIGELPGALQTRLLRVLEHGELRRVGAEQTRAVRVRVVCATHRDLRKMVADGLFREDLYYRIARLVVQVPALRSRPEDIALLAAHFLEEIASELGPRVLSEQARQRLLAHAWPGNVRELRNVLGAAAAATGSPVLEAHDIDAAIARVTSRCETLHVSSEHIQRALSHHEGNLSAAARSLGIPRTTLRDRVKQAGLTVS